jgi:hypothetical protein
MVSFLMMLIMLKIFKKVEFLWDDERMTYGRMAKDR